MQVVVLVETPEAEVARVAQLCRAAGVKFIWAGAYGLFSRIFVDVGPTHTVTDKDGEACITTVITGVSQVRWRLHVFPCCVCRLGPASPYAPARPQEPKGVVLTLEDQRHGFETGDYVQFSQVEGMTELNTLGPVKITVTGQSLGTRSRRPQPAVLLGVLCGAQGRRRSRSGTRPISILTPRVGTQPKSRCPSTFITSVCAHSHCILCFSDVPRVAEGPAEASPPNSRFP